MRIPGIACQSAVPGNSASRERVARELGDEHGPRIFQPLGDRRFHVDDAVPILRGAPGRGIARIGDDVLDSPRDSVQRSTIFFLSQFTVGLLRLFDREVVHEGDDALEQRIVAVKPVEIELRQFDG